MPQALEIVVTAPIASFRHPIYSGLQVGLPCPPPSTVGGMLAAAAGGWDRVPVGTRFAMAFHAAGAGVDLETYHPLARRGVSTNPTIMDREFLTGITLTIWLTDHLDMWERRLRRPVWPLRLGRSQDLATARPRRVDLVTEPGNQGHAIIPDSLSTVGSRLRLTTAVSLDRARSRWDGYRYAEAPLPSVIDTGLSTAAGQAVALLPPVHPAQFTTTAATPNEEVS
jgi:CRISPR-associated Cas5-like protein